MLGAIDCTHVRIVPPTATEHLYRNRKHTHSINVQAIVDHRGLFTNIMAKYPGSVHDSFIFRHSTINRHFQDERYGNGLLVEIPGAGGVTRTTFTDAGKQCSQRPEMVRMRASLHAMESGECGPRAQEVVEERRVQSLASAVKPVTGESGPNQAPAR
ncbi:hypothetical protein NDU88_006397 [Pleurodeles waltl]|uniref:DDE Tnp4 domain-containing protein n=1 Tax=Pleurodeles waltl TaxID=8319 RepID=A0AAV7NU01_PLEWA|nr:hypothetical protein NDU88_006397 [Pleurodeles waltl]